jgi:hypothetical protein
MNTPLVACIVVGLLLPATPTPASSPPDRIQPAQPAQAPVWMQRSYSPSGVAKNGWHQLQVRIKGRKATVKARPGYSAGS